MNLSPSHSARGHQLGQPIPLASGSLKSNLSGLLASTSLSSTASWGNLTKCTSYSIITPSMALQSPSDKAPYPPHGGWLVLFPHSRVSALGLLLPSPLPRMPSPSTRSSAITPFFCESLTQPSVLAWHAGHVSSPSKEQPVLLDSAASGVSNVEQDQEPVTVTLQGNSHPQGARCVQREQLSICPTKGLTRDTRTEGWLCFSLWLLRACLFTVGCFPKRT